MKASFVDFRTKSSQIIRALRRNESVTIMYRGKPAGVIQPIGGEQGKPKWTAATHPAFGIWANREDMKDVAKAVRRLRRSRFDDL